MLWSRSFIVFVVVVVFAVVWWLLLLLLLFSCYWCVFSLPSTFSWVTLSLSLTRNLSYNTEGQGTAYLCRRVCCSVVCAGCLFAAYTINCRIESHSNFSVRVCLDMFSFVCPLAVFFIFRLFTISVFFV